jgi:hypothetical protein
LITGHAPLARAPRGIVGLYAALLLTGAGLLAAAIMMVMWPTAGTLTNASGFQAGHDFVAFYAAGRFVAHGVARAAYDADRMRATIQAILGTPAAGIPWSYPPGMFLLVGPLGWLPPLAALVAWYALLGASAVAAVWVVTGSWRLAVLAPVAPPTIVDLVSGQTGTVVAALFATIVAFWGRNPRLAGVALGCLACKPHLAIAPAALALCLGAWRVLAAAAATVALLTAASLTMFGAEAWPAWLAAIARQADHVVAHRIPLERMLSTFALAYRLTDAARLASALHALAALGALAAMLHLWRRTTDLATRALALALAALVVPPYAFHYDAAVLLVPIAALAAGRVTAAAFTPAAFTPAAFTPEGARWIAALCILPLLFILAADLTALPLAAPMLLALLAAAFARACQDARPNATSLVATVSAVRPGAAW